MTAPSLAIGTIVAGRYTVHALLGRRAGRATYHCITAPNRHVAVKLLDPSFAQTDAQAALAMAAAAASELSEGAVLHVVDRGIDPDTGSPFFVSPLSDHPSLEAFVSLCPLSLTEMATMARSLARGLDVAHRRGLAHLALRPTNVFVGPPPACWTRTADFGAGAIDRALGLADRETLSFAAPELYAGAPGPLSTEGAARADVFSAALLCFYAAAGDTYWKATRRRGGGTPGSDLEPLALEASGVRAPASVAAREIGAAWNPALDVAFARALSSAPSARYASVGELADALAEALEMPRAGGAPALADSLMRGDAAPHTVRFDDDDEPATRMVTAGPPALPGHDAPASVAPPPESIAPMGPRGGGASVGPRGMGGTMILESTAPPTSPSVMPAMPPPAALPAFGSTSGSYALPAPYPSVGPGALAAADAVEAAPRPRRSWTGLVIAALAGVAVVGAVATALVLRGTAGASDPVASSPAMTTAAPAGSERAPASAAPRATAAAAVAPAEGAAPSSSAAPAATAEATAAPEGAAATPPPPATAAPAPDGPIPTTYGQQPKPKVEQLDPPTTWYAELVVSCAPTCDLVLVQGGPTTNPELPKQLPPGTYTVTVRQSGGIQSQAAVLRAATRTTLTFDGRLVVPEPPPARP